MFEAKNRLKPQKPVVQASENSTKEEVVIYPGRKANPGSTPLADDETFNSGLAPAVTSVMSKIRFNWDHMTSQDVCLADSRIGFGTHSNALRVLNLV